MVFMKATCSGDVGEEVDVQGEGKKDGNEYGYGNGFFFF